MIPHFSEENILYEDTEVLVCKKPSGIPTQSNRIGTPDMVSILKNHLSSASKQKGEPYLAVIHRLDQPVEGLLVFAKTPFAAKVLNRQLQQFGFGKYYRAKLTQTPDVHEATLTHHMFKDGRSNTSRICSAATPGAKKAELTYQIAEQFEDGTCIAEITLKTGRHHQIRVQMASIGCPIVGDRKYGSADHISDANLQLFACRLEFRHPKTGKPLVFHLN